MPRDAAIPFDYFHDISIMVRIHSKDKTPHQRLVDVIREADSEEVKVVDNDTKRRLLRLMNSLVPHVHWHREPDFPDHEWYPAVVRRHELDTCARDYDAGVEAFPTTIGNAPFQLQGATSQLRTFNKKTGMLMVSLDPSDQSTAAWLCASQRITSGEDLISELLWYLRSYTPAHMDLTCDEKEPFIQQFRPSFLQWERTLHQEKIARITVIRDRQESNRGLGVRGNANPDPLQADVDDNQLSPRWNSIQLPGMEWKPII